MNDPDVIAWIRLAVACSDLESLLGMGQRMGTCLAIVMLEQGLH